MNNKFLKRKKGFTFVEMMVSVGIITLLSVMILGYNRQTETTTNLTRSANKLISELKRIQNQAMLILEENTTQGSKNICGWGMYFAEIPGSNLSIKEITPFVDYCDQLSGAGNQQYDKIKSEGKTPIPLVKKTEITETNIRSIVFVPPEPTIYFDPETVDKAIIKLYLEDQNSPYYIITISKSGQISKELKN